MGCSGILSFFFVHSTEADFPTVSRFLFVSGDVEYVHFVPFLVSRHGSRYPNSVAKTVQKQYYYHCKFHSTYSKCLGYSHQIINFIYSTS